MDLNTPQTAGIGFFSSSVISFMHFEDIIMALILGFFGAAGAYLFKVLFHKK